MGLEPPRYAFDTSVVVSALLFEQSVPGMAFWKRYRLRVRTGPDRRNP